MGTLFRLKILLFFFQDLFISGDVDEVLSRGALHQLKWCQVREDVITGGQMPLQRGFHFLSHFEKSV